MYPEKEYASVAGTVLVVSLCLGLGAAFLYALNAFNQSTAACMAKSHGKEYTVESPYGTTSAGCTITKVEKFYSSCWSQGYVYVTDCRGSVSWDKKNGKSTVRESNSSP